MKKYIVFLFLILTVILTICPIFAAETERRDSTANFPWAQQRSYYQTTGSFLTIGEEELERRTLGDLRNRLTGMMPAISVQEKAGDFWSSSYQSPNLNSSSFLAIKCVSSTISIFRLVKYSLTRTRLSPSRF